MGAHSKFPERYGPSALVTGASSGIGRAFAEQLAARGLDLVLNARSAGPLEQLSAELSARYGVACAAAPADLGAEDGVARLIDQIGEAEIGLLVLAAGYGTSGAFLDIAPEAERDMVRVNCEAGVALLRALTPAMAARGRGGAVLMSSIVAFQGVPRAANYAATKAYVQTLAEGLAVELAPAGVDVLACAPGPVASGFAARAGMRMGAAQSPRSVARGALRRLGRARTVRPGFRSAFLGLSLGLLPRRVRTSIMTGIMAGMTGG